jgi:hypothetical protein
VQALQHPHARLDELLVDDVAVALHLDLVQDHAVQEAKDDAVVGLGDG